MLSTATAPRFVLFSVMLLLAGCGPSGPLTMSTLQLGRSINSDDSVGNHATRFKTDETVYAAVLTDSPGSSTIKATWKFGGRTMSEEEKTVSFREPAATEFHIRAAGGLPPGDYRVEIQIDGTAAGSRDFKVER